MKKRRSECMGHKASRDIGILMQRVASLEITVRALLDESLDDEDSEEPVQEVLNYVN